MSLGNIDLTPQLVQAVRDAVDVVDIASEHTRLRKAGNRHQGLCPIHKEKTPSFSVDPLQGLFYCFGCGAGGDAIKLHMLLSGDDFPAAIESLARRYGIPVAARSERRGPGGGGRPERDLEGALEAAAKFFKEQLRRSDFARGYLERRRIPRELVESFGLGYAPDAWHDLQQALHPRVPLADLEAAGLVGRSERSGEPYDRFRHRLMFPIRNPSGRLVGFGGRALGDDRAKYVNTAETERFHKGLLLYGLHESKREIREGGRALLVEGYFDVIGTAASGLAGAVAGMGTALTPEQAKLLSRYAEVVVVGYDGDEAGENAFRRALPLLLAEGLDVRRAVFPAGHDPDSLRLEAGPEAVAAAFDKAEDAVLLEMDRLTASGMDDPQQKARAAKAVAELLRPIPDGILRQSYARTVARTLMVSPEMLARRAGGRFEEPPPPARGPEGAGARRLVRSLEEQILERLLRRGGLGGLGEAGGGKGGDGPLPPIERLPPPEVFFDTECRNIYRVWRALYAEGPDGPPPDARAVQAALGAEPGIVDRLARILLEGSFAPGKIGLAESLDMLERRWRQKRLQELQGEIDQAQRKGDHALLERLVDEKTGLSRSLHRGIRAGFESEAG